MTHENSSRPIRAGHLHAASALVAVALMLGGCGGGGDAGDATVSSGMDYKSSVPTSATAARSSEQLAGMEYKSSMPKKKERKQLSPDIDLDPGARREMEDESEEDESESGSGGRGKGQGQGQGKAKGDAGERSARR